MSELTLVYSHKGGNHDNSHNDLNRVDSNASTVVAGDDAFDYDNVSVDSQASTVIPDEVEFEGDNESVDSQASTVIAGDDAFDYLNGGAIEDENTEGDVSTDEVAVDVSEPEKKYSLKDVLDAVDKIKTGDCDMNDLIVELEGHVNGLYQINLDIEIQLGSIKVQIEYIVKKIQELEGRPDCEEQHNKLKAQLDRLNEEKQKIEKFRQELNNMNDLPEGWSASLVNDVDDEDNGKMYYSHPEKESSWTRPTEVGETTDATETAETDEITETENKNPIPSLKNSVSNVMSANRMINAFREELRKYDDITDEEVSSLESFLDNPRFTLQDNRENIKSILEKHPKYFDIIDSMIENNSENTIIITFNGNEYVFDEPKMEFYKSAIEDIRTQIKNDNQNNTAMGGNHKKNNKKTRRNKKKNTKRMIKNKKTKKAKKTIKKSLKKKMRKNRKH